ncbi:MAG: leucine-rich repeat domain-containing protein [Clostridia bacterium]|nr:leucine-rich repeat domain-containing protein [Clostridia bacterium]
MKSKKIFSLVTLTLVISMLLFSVSCTENIDEIEYEVVSENNVTEDGLVYSVYENNTIVITGREADHNELTIPDEIDGKKVVEIGAKAFEKDEALILLTLGKNVEKISNSAFSECIYLARVQATASLKQIGQSSFYACERLAEVIGATKLESIGIQAFYNCLSLAYFDFPETLTKLEDDAFSGCESITEIVLPSKLKTIGIQTFSYCTSLTRVSMGNITSVPDKAFFNCP